MFRRYSKSIAAIALFFFTWTCGGGFSLAHAAQDIVKKGKAQGAQKSKASRPEERFAKLTEDLEATLADSKVDAQHKQSRLVAGKAEIDALDKEIRIQFAETEQRLKDHKLPTEILERHRKFVKHYDDNLAELKGNIEQVEKAKDSKELEAQLERTATHLKRVKAPSLHQPFDPNNLPHGVRKSNGRKPRMKKEDFQRDLKKDKHAWRHQKKIMIASTGSVSGLLAPDDLTETIDVQFTPAIVAKAQELGNNPVKIYEWVRNNVEFVPTWGSIQGADMTLQTMQGNAFDISSLLIALLRAAGIQAHYVIGTIELPIDKVMNWAGGFTDPMAALDFMSSGGVPTTGLVEGGVITKARLEHVWVQAYINYMPSRGAKHVNGKEDTWISLDPSFKQYNFTQGIDIKNAVPFDAQSFLTQMQSGATIDNTLGSVTGLNSLAAQQTMQDYKTQVQNYIQQNYPNATVGDVLGKKTIIAKQYPYLLGTLPYRTAVTGGTFSTIPDSLRQQLSFNVDQTGVASDPDTALNISKSLPELAGKKITLSYSPATSQDEAVINSYLPAPNPDSTPIQPSQLPSSLPAYLINVKPELRIDGQVVAIGDAIGLGGTNTFTMKFVDPTYGATSLTSYIDAGVYQGIGLNLGRISQSQLSVLNSTLDATKMKLQNQAATLTKEEIVGDFLYLTAITYHAELGAIDSIVSRSMGVNHIVLPSETIFATGLNVGCLLGSPVSVSAGGLKMDAKSLVSVVKAKDGDSGTARNFMVNSGTTSSALENSIPEQLLSFQQAPVAGVSSVKALKIANDQGIPIFTINGSNISSVLPQLDVSYDVKADIQNAVNTGKIVTVSKSNINSNGWNGCGYIISNPETGAGAYMISAGLNGAYIGVDIEKCFSCTPFFKTMTWLLASIVSVTAMFLLTPEAGAILTIALPFATTAFLKMVCQDYTVSVKDILFYVSSVMAWTVAGAGVMMLIDAEVMSSLIGVITMALILMPVIAADLIYTLAINFVRKTVLEDMA